LAEANLKFRKRILSKFSNYFSNNCANTISGTQAKICRHKKTGHEKEPVKTKGNTMGRSKNLSFPLPFAEN
jgi:hypothetical protein